MYIYIYIDPVAKQLPARAPATMARWEKEELRRELERSHA